MPRRAELLQILLDAIGDVQVASGRSLGDTGAATPLFGGIDGFDSLNGLEVLVTVGAKLDDQLPDELLVRDGAPLTVGDLADRILARLEGDDGDA